MAAPAAYNINLNNLNAENPTHQRPGKPGIDYDDYGTEMAPNARVWKRYIEETDATDKEMVQGWNKMLDVILIFAALFSAISTAFVIESSKDLKPDYAEISAQTLLVVSQTLLSMSTNAPANSSTSISTEPPSPVFAPSRPVVIVNTLWFLSLSLSVAVSLIAILAKEWCYSFMAGRTGTILKQARVRQQRWDGVERWKMKEILNVLPLMMHTALLFFAIGLSIYLWNINMQVALPVVITTTVSALFYGITAGLSLIFRFCPYTTALVRFIHPHWVEAIQNDRIKDLAGALMMLPAGLSHWLEWLRLQRIINLSGRSHPVDGQESRPHNSRASFSFCQCFDGTRGRVNRWVEHMRWTFSSDRSQLIELETPMDGVTSSMLSWMITNCEDSRSVDMALQALAGAEPWLPRRSLWQCGALQLVSQRLRSRLSALEGLPPRACELEHNRMLEDACLYSRSLNFLAAFVQGKGFTISRHDVTFKSTLDDKSLAGMNIKTGDAISCIRNSHLILRYSIDGTACRHELAAFELNNFSPEIDTNTWRYLESRRKQCSRQWQLLKKVTSGEVANLPAAAVLALVNGITKTCLYYPFQSPTPLVDLLNMTSPQEKPTLRHAIGIALTVVALANHDFSYGQNDASDDACLRRAKQAYYELSSRKIQPSETDSLLAFGLLGLLAKHRYNLSFGEDEIKAVSKSLSSIVFDQNSPKYQGIIPALPTTFGCQQHFAQVVLGWLHASHQEPSPLSKSSSRAVSYLGAILCDSLCRAFGADLIIPLGEHFETARSVELRVIYLRGLRYSLVDHSLSTAAIRQLGQTVFLSQLFRLTVSSNDRILPYVMRFLWVVINNLLIYGYRWPTSALRIVKPVFDQSPHASARELTSSGLPRSIGDMGFVELWISNLTNMCDDDPQNVIDSGILGEMIEFYQRGGGRSLQLRFTSQTPEQLTTPEASRNCLKVLQELQTQCEAAIEQQNKESERGLLADDEANDFDEEGSDPR